MRVLVGVGTIGGATMVTVGSLVRQSVTRELPEKQLEAEKSGLASLQQEGWCLIKEALPASQVAESLGSFKKGVTAGTSSQLLKKAGFWQSSLGRFHLQTFSEDDKSVLAEVEEAWLPFVQSHLPGIERSGLQLLFSVPRLRPSTSPSFNLHQMAQEGEAIHRIAHQEAGLWAQAEDHVAMAVEEAETKEESSVELESPPPGA